MRHLCKGRKLKRTSSHKKALMNNLATALFEHKKIETTEAKAKELRPFAEKLITRAKHALARESQGMLPEGHNTDIHNRREVGRYIRNKAVLQELFDAIAPVVEDRNGGYTRIVKTGTRRGDGGRTAIIELVDYSAPQDGSVSIKGKKKRRPARKDKPVEEKKAAPAKEEIKEETPKAEENAEETTAQAEVTETPEAAEEETPKAEEAPKATEEAHEEKAEEAKPEEAEGEEGEKKE